MALSSSVVLPIGASDTPMWRNRKARKGLREGVLRLPAPDREAMLTARSAVMEILIVRHAIAEDYDAERWPDDRGRPLTREGTKRFGKAARALAALVRMPDAVWSSGLRRALQTAEILSDEAGWPKSTTCEALEPLGDPKEILAVLDREPAEACIVLVGHEPDLHELVSFFLTGTDDGATVEMKKGGAALLGFDAKPRAGGAVLRWLLPPKVLVAAPQPPT
jgi:phosphohistidine phosphatase